MLDQKIVIWGLIIVNEHWRFWSMIIVPWKYGWSYYWYQKVFLKFLLWGINFKHLEFVVSSEIMRLWLLMYKECWGFWLICLVMYSNLVDGFWEWLVLWYWNFGKFWVRSWMLKKCINEMKNFNWVQGSSPILKYKYLCVDSTKRLRTLRRTLMC
jgi:hypothetical protein